jgi:hypothetical protein
MIEIAEEDYKEYDAFLFRIGSIEFPYGKGMDVGGLCLYALSLQTSKREYTIFIN